MPSPTRKTTTSRAAFRALAAVAVMAAVTTLKRGYVFVTVPQLLAPGKAEPGAVYR